MKILFSLILLMSLPAFSENTEPVDHTKQAELINQIRQGEKDLRWADLRWADLRGANLKGADLSKTDLRWADLRKAELEGASLYRADLQTADLRWAGLEGATLYRADLTEAFMSLTYKYRDMIMRSGALNTDKINWMD